jgi:protein-export membrane protein SecD
VSARVQVRFHARSTASAYPDAAAMNTIRDIVLRRLEAAGFADPVVTLDDRSTVVVDLPQGTDSGLVRSIIEPQGQLTFVPLPADTYGTSTTTSGPTGVIDGQPLPDDASLKPLLTGAAISAANPATDQGGVPAVQFELDAAATKLFADYTRDHVNEFFAIVLDGTVISAPSIREPITSGSGLITMEAGTDAVKQMNDLVTVLRSGSLPFKLDWAGPATPPSTSP